MEQTDGVPVGLTSGEARRRLVKHGPNRLPEAATHGLHAIIAKQFLSPFIYMLLAAMAVSLLIGQIPSAVFIGAVLLLNAAIGTVQEFSAQRSANALRQMIRGNAQVIRDGVPQRVDIADLVPGDVIMLSSGDKVPADLRLESAENLSVDESLLTGESMAVHKDSAANIAPDAPLADRVDCCFAGTIVTRGRGRGEITATAGATEIGLIARDVSEGVQADPPLMIRIRRFTYQVAAVIGFAIVALIVIMSLRGGYDIESMVMMAIGLAVSTIPEGLPAALTIALAIGMSRMAANRVIIRRLVAVEALGSCTFICSDKTGTLTVNELTIHQVMLPDGEGFRVTGEGVRPGGEITGGELQRLRDLCMTGILANEGRLDYAGGEWVSDGDIVDVAFLVLAKKLGLSISSVRTNCAQTDLIPYESERAFSGSLNRDETETRLHLKGSPERLLALCDRMAAADGGVIPIDKEAITAQAEALAGDGYRLIALAQKVARDGNADSQLGDMVFLGMVGMIDPIRPEAKDAIRKCRDGGIGVAMVTGDHPTTAHAIAIELGMAEPGDAVVTGPMIRAAQEKRQVADLIANSRVFARIEPAQKEQIVEAFIRAGHFVAVTGDGVNDAPAMRRANAAVAMGRNGTDVARETADLIITDDNFASIVHGIEQGRVVYNNIRKVIALLTATGFSALVLFFFSVFAGLPIPLVALQLLWLNLVANGLQDVALAFEPKEGNELDSPPRAPGEPVFERKIIEHVLVVGGTMGVLAFLVFQFFLDQGRSIDEVRNLVLMLLVMFGNIHAMSARSEHRSIFRIPLRSNLFLMLAIPLSQMVHIAAMYVPGLRDVLEIQPISLVDWLSLLSIALVLLAVEEVHKWRVRRGAASHTVT